MVEEKKFTVLDLLSLDLKGHDALNLKCVGGRKGLSRNITLPDLNRPGLALSGFFDSFGFARVQVFGQGECTFLSKLVEDKKLDVVKKFFTYDIPCCVFTRDISPPEEFLQLAEEAKCAVLQTDLASTDFSSRILRVFSDIFAEHKVIHGVFIEVYGIGIIISGTSGVGKSETALELVHRGHRLVADDVVEIRCVNGNILLGRGPNKMISHHMEIRGLGIINIQQLYGVGAIREQKEVQLLVKLEEWNPQKVYDRLGTAENTEEILGVKIPVIEVPVKPGRNIPIILETAAMNERLKSMGYHSARDFNQNVLRWIESGESQSDYYGAEDIY